MGNRSKWETAGDGTGLVITIELLSQVAILCIFAYLIIADWRKRSVSLGALLLYGALLLWSLSNKYSATATLPESGINTVFLIVQFALVVGVLRLRKSQVSFRRGMGSGDIVFLLLSAWGWSTTIFLTAYLSGLIVALLLAIGLQRGKPAGDFPIPLLTALGFSFGSVLAVHWYF